MVRSIEDLPSSPDTAAAKLEHPILSGVGLSVLWAGHSTCLIQIGDKIFLTDPIFTKTAGMISKRKIESGIIPSSITKLDYVLISHLHFDHLSYGSLEMIPKNAVRNSKLLFPEGGSEYIPEFGFSKYQEMKLWSSFEADGVRITSVPVKHFNGRYGFDIGWFNNDTFTGYIIEYQGKTIFFAGDTGYDPEKFKEIGRKFKIDVALIPIAPVEPHDFMKRVHADPEEALQIFDDVRAKFMIPIHYRTFMQGTDSSMTYAQNRLQQIIIKNKIEEKVKILNIGQQYIFIP